MTKFNKIIIDMNMNINYNTDTIATYTYGMNKAEANEDIKGPYL